MPTVFFAHIFLPLFNHSESSKMTTDPAAKTNRSLIETMVDGTDALSVNRV